MSPTKIKICGFTQTKQVELVSQMPIEAVGFICYPPSKRYVKPKQLKDLVKATAPLTQTVGVFVDEDPQKLIDLMKETGLGLAQLHGEEDTSYTTKLDKAGVKWMKAIKVQDSTDLKIIGEMGLDVVLLDSYSPQKGGSGETFDWSLADEATRLCKVILAGGLTLENIQQAIWQVDPWGIDISSGVESDKGIKDLKKIERLLQTVGRL